MQEGKRSREKKTERESCQETYSSFKLQIEIDITLSNLWNILSQKNSKYHNTRFIRNFRQAVLNKYIFQFYKHYNIKIEKFLAVIYFRNFVQIPFFVQKN